MSSVQSVVATVSPDCANSLYIGPSSIGLDVLLLQLCDQCLVDFIQLVIRQVQSQGSCRQQQQYVNLKGNRKFVVQFATPIEVLFLAHAWQSAYIDARAGLHIVL